MRNVNWYVVCALAIIASLAVGEVLIVAQIIKGQ